MPFLLSQMIEAYRWIGALIVISVHATNTFLSLNDIMTAPHGPLVYVWWFVANFALDGKEQAHRERSKFRADETHGWFFLEEANRKPEPVVKGKQPGRNDPCPCGSGKKYKKCCALAA